MNNIFLIDNIMKSNIYLINVHKYSIKLDYTQGLLYFEYTNETVIGLYNMSGY